MWCLAYELDCPIDKKVVQLDDSDVLHGVEVERHTACELPPLVHEPFVDDHFRLELSEEGVQLHVMLFWTDLEVLPFAVDVCSYSRRSAWIECNDSHSVSLLKREYILKSN